KDADGCYTWSTPVSTASGGLQCFVGSAPATREGVGVLKCNANECSVGDKRASSGGSEGEYQVCEQSGAGCPVWSSKRICPAGLIFNEEVDDCVCPPSTGSAGDSECTSSSSRTVYTAQSISGKLCTVAVQETLHIQSERV